MTTHTIENLKYGWFKENPISLSKIWERRLAIASWGYLAFGFVGLIWLECRLNHWIGN